MKESIMTQPYLMRNPRVLFVELALDIGAWRKAKE
jgi:hypothetical protein